MEIIAPVDDTNSVAMIHGQDGRVTAAEGEGGTFVGSLSMSRSISESASRDDSNVSNRTEVSFRQQESNVPLG